MIYHLPGLLRIFRKWDLKEVQKTWFNLDKKYFLNKESIVKIYRSFLIFTLNEKTIHNSRV